MEGHMYQKKNIISDIGMLIEMEINYRSNTPKLNIIR